jgi:hypothetical protein
VSLLQCINLRSGESATGQKQASQEMPARPLPPGADIEGRHGPLEAPQG